MTQQFNQPRNDGLMLQSYLENYTKLIGNILEKREPQINEKFDGMVEGMGRALDVYAKLLPKPESPESIINQVRTLMEIQEKMRPKTSWVEELLPLVQVIGERLVSQFQNRLPQTTPTPSQPPAEMKQQNFSREDFETVSLDIFRKYLGRAKRNEDVKFSVDSFIADLEDLVQFGLITIEDLRKKIEEISDISFLNYLKAKMPDYSFDDIMPWLSEFRLEIKKYLKAESDNDEQTLQA